jgi:hypothetical protein
MSVELNYRMRIHYCTVELPNVTRHPNVRIEKCSLHLEGELLNLADGTSFSKRSMVIFAPGRNPFGVECTPVICSPIINIPE